jgi:hypothetical protein
MLGGHAANGFPCAQNRSSHVDFEYVLEGLKRNILNPCKAASYTGIVDQPFDGTEFAFGSLKEAHDVALSCNVGADRDGSSTFARYLVNNFASLLLTSIEVHRDSISTPRTQNSDSSTDAATGSGDNQRPRF